MRIERVGGINIYKVEFKRSLAVRPVRVGGSWEYYDDFRTGRYLADAAEVQGMVSTYTGTHNVANTYGYFGISRSGTEPGNLEYVVQIPEGTDEVYVRSVILMKAKEWVSIVLKNEGGVVLHEYQYRAKGEVLHKPEVRIQKRALRSDILRVCLRIGSEGGSSNGDPLIKSVQITEMKKASMIQVGSEESKGGTIYDAELEGKKSPRWAMDTIENDGWIQANDGVLFKIIEGEGVGGLRIGLASMAPLLTWKLLHKDLYT